MATDPRTIIDQQPMSRFQWGIVATMVGLNALDGFDVLSISFASPGIASAWGIDRAALGIVLSMELIGMAVGSVLILQIKVLPIGLCSMVLPDFKFLKIK